ncbi:MAG: DUF5009 domain-containing protein [Planctomycetota bacterium]
MSLEHEPVPIEDTIPDSLLAPTGDSLDLPAHLGKSRLGSIDAFRGFVMFLLMAEALHLSHMARNFPESKIWKTLAYHQTHVEWIGCSLHDMIQPSFSFLVGVSLPFSLLSRRQNGQSKKKMTLHAIWRAFALVALGIFLRSVGRKQTNFTFEDTLSQIGLGYCFLFLLGLKTRKVQWIALCAILISYWALFAAYPLPSTDFDYSAVGLDKNSSSFLTGFQAHWNKNTNPAWAFDTWFMNLFPREKPFAYNGGGYSTISFIPTLATMILGLIAGGMMNRPIPAWKNGLQFVVMGIAFAALGYGIGEMGICPVVKKIWTPSWVLFSGGICFAFLSFFVFTCDAAGMTPLFWPIRIIGANCIYVYVVIHWWNGFIQSNLKTHLGQNIFQAFGASYEPVVAGASVMMVHWLILVWMDRNKIRIRI